MKKSILIAGFVMLVAVFGSFTSQASGVTAPALKLSYEVLRVSSKGDKNSIQKNTLVFLPNIDGTYTATQDFKLWSESQIICAPKDLYCTPKNVSSGIQFSFLPEFLLNNETMVVHFKSKIGSENYRFNNFDSAVTINPGNQEINLPNYYQLKTTLELVASP